MTCHGNCESHCCYFHGIVCPYVEEDTVSGRRWTCGLFRELGDWDEVVKDERYVKEVQSLFDTVPGFVGKDYTCANYPQEVGVVVRQKDCGWYEE
jgi:hypothetical protein